MQVTEHVRLRRSDGSHSSRRWSDRYELVGTPILVCDTTERPSQTWANERFIDNPASRSDGAV
jgi:hypothetical protein